MTDTYPPKLPDQMLGHARVCDRKNSALGGPATLSLFGSQDSPQLYAYSPDTGGTGLIPRRDDLIRFCREVLTFLGEYNGVELPPWMPKNASIGSRSWFLSRYHTTEPSIPLADKFHYGANGSVIRYGSKETAQKAADKLNAAEKAASANDSTTNETPASDPASDIGRWFVVVIREKDGKLNALSHRTPGLDGTPFHGPWGLLTEDEAVGLADTYNTIEDDSVAEAVEVFRYEHDPEWPEQYT